MDELVIDEKDLATYLTEALQGKVAAQRIRVGAQIMQMGVFQQPVKVE